MPAPQTGLDADARLRAEVAALLRGGNAHVDAAAILDGIPFDRVNEQPEGLPYSLWDLVYHLWFSQHDLLVFSINPDYQGHDWPADYWPSDDATETAWGDTVQAFSDDLDKLVRLVESPKTDLLAELDHAPGYTLLRQALLAADHNAHHLGQVITVRRLLGIWEPQT
ncbi:MAG: DinB family protein [Rubricoccaceae bacterium]|nr:DinB family protein [Rubricoccaceae bacterium]